MVGTALRYWQARRSRPRTGASIIEYALITAALGLMAVALVAPLRQDRVARLPATTGPAISASLLP